MENTERLELKILALKEELSNRDDRIADLRVGTHELTMRLNETQVQLNSVQEELDSLREENSVREEASAETKPEDSDGTD